MRAGRVSCGGGLVVRDFFGFGFAWRCWLGFLARGRDECAGTGDAVLASPVGQQTVVADFYEA